MAHRSVLSSFDVEAFYNGKFYGWFPVSDMASLLNTLSDFERAEKVTDLKLSYLVFAPNPQGIYKSSTSSKHYQLVCRINSKGKECPEFFKKVG
jgi:hypothetical protein